MRYRLEYVVRGTQYTMRYADRRSAIGNACNMMKNQDCTALQLIREHDGFPLMTYRLEEEHLRQKGYIET